MGIVDFDNNVAALTDVGLVRPHNEDSNRVAKTANGDLFVVCDGMGGHVGGATASRIGVDSLCSFVESHECSIPQQFLVKALEYANSQIYAQARSNPDLRGMGTTACVALVREDKVWYAHVGDSRIYYYNARKHGLYRLTKDHSVVQALVDQGLITEAEAEHHPEKNKIRKSLGIKEDVEPEPCQMPLLPAEGDILLICSDGLSGMMSEDDILEVLSTTPDINEAGKVLVELAKSGGGTDNITVQLVRFSNVGNREAVFDPKNKGISRIQEKDKKSSVKWPIWLIIASAILLVVAVIVLLTGKKESRTDSPAAPQVEHVEEQNALPAYFQFIKGKPGTRINNDCVLYKNVTINGKTADVYVNEKTHYWQFGKFTQYGNSLHKDEGETYDRNFIESPKKTIE